MQGRGIHITGSPAEDNAEGNNQDQLQPRRQKSNTLRFYLEDTSSPRIPGFIEDTGTSEVYLNLSAEWLSCPCWETLVEERPHPMPPKLDWCPPDDVSDKVQRGLS